jgi:hypothetical protein
VIIISKKKILYKFFFSSRKSYILYNNLTVNELNFRHGGFYANKKKIMTKSHPWYFLASHRFVTFSYLVRKKKHYLISYILSFSVYTVNFKDSFNNCSKTLSFPSKRWIPHLGMANKPKLVGPVRTRTQVNGWNPSWLGLGSGVTRYFGCGCGITQTHTRNPYTHPFI